MAFKKCIVEFDHETGQLKDLNGSLWNWAGAVLQPYEEAEQALGQPISEGAIVRLAAIGYSADDILKLEASRNI